MVLSHVEDGCRDGFQAGGRLQLETGKFKHVQFARRIQQHQRRQADIAANADVHARRLRHLAHQGSDGAFSVRAGNGDNRRLRLAAKQLDIADDFHASVGRSAQ